MTDRKKITIADIAEAAMVSKTTVSRYINGNFGSMSQETRERIGKVIAMSGYRPNAIAQSLKGNASHLIGLVVADISSPFISSMIRGVSHVLEEAGYIPMVADCKDSPELESRIYDAMLGHHVDGLIVNTSSYINPRLIQMECSGLPVVLCDRYVRDYHFSYVGLDHRTPIREAVEHLQAQGFSKVAFFTEEYEKISARFIRRESFLQGMAQLYPHLDTSELSVLVDISKGKQTQEKIQQLIDSTDGTPAIVACNTMTLMHVVSELHAMGVRIPQDVGICGPDDWGFADSIEWTSIVSPPLTTFMVDPYTIGCRLAEMMMEKIKHPDLPKQEIVLPCRLNIRESTLLHSDNL